MENSSSNNDELAQSFADRLTRHQQAKASALEGADDALALLMEVAKRDTGQSRVCRSFLLGLYNGTAWPFTLTDLRGLDLELLQAALIVLRADAIGAWPEEVHKVSNEPELFGRWAADRLLAQDSQDSGEAS